MLPALEHPSKSSRGQRDSNAHYRHLIVLPTCPRTCDGGYAFLAQVLFPPKLIPLTRRMAERNLFRAKFNSDYNDFVARVALEVVDSSWCKQQLRVKSAGSRTTALPSNEEASRQPYSTSRVSAPTWCPRQSLLQYSVRFPFGGKSWDSVRRPAQRRFSLLVSVFDEEILP